MDDPSHGRDVRAPQIEDVVSICQSLNQAGARYLLIGGFAVIAHGAGRTTKDIDFLVDPEPSNIGLIKEALSFLPDQAVLAVKDTDVREYSVVRIADEVMIDLLAEACGVTYAEAYPDSQIFEIDGIDIPIASKQTLIATKNTIRPSDHMDRNFLQALIDEEPIS